MLPWICEKAHWARIPPTELLLFAHPALEHNQDGLVSDTVYQDSTGDKDCCLWTLQKIIYCNFFSGEENSAHAAGYLHQIVLLAGLIGPKICTNLRK
jgi:hypothetical protein